MRGLTNTAQFAGWAPYVQEIKQMWGEGQGVVPPNT